MRIQLFSNLGNQINDRLVDQKTEFYTGPKEVHEGPMRIEFVFEDASDTEGAIDYLKKLSGMVPIETKTAAKKATSGNKEEYDSTSREVLLDEAEKASKNNQDTFITYLRERDFVFMTSDQLKTIIPDSYKFKAVHLENYEWLVRRTKTAKDPRADKFDISLLLGIKILSERSDRILLYKNGENQKSIRLEVPEKAFNFKQTNLIKFPHYMIYEEREKWGIEHRQLMANPDKKPSKFYQRWIKDVDLGNELKIKKNGQKD